MWIFEGILQTECRPISKSRILESHIRFDSNDGISRLERTIQHLVPTVLVLLNTLASTWAVGFCLTKFTERFSSALAYVAKSLRQHFFGVFVVVLNSIAGYHNTVCWASEKPFNLLWNQLVCR